MEPTELETLKERADQMGLKYHPKIGMEKLKAMIEKALSDEPAEETPAPVDETPKETPALTKGQIKAKMRREAMKLVRVRVACMNPQKKEWEGEIISAGNSMVGQIKKYVPFNTEDGWHIPQIIYNYMKEKKCQVFYTAKDEKGRKVRRGKQIPEYNIEVLPPLTEEELKELAQRQAMANGAAA